MTITATVSYTHLDVYKRQFLGYLLAYTIFSWFSVVRKLYPTVYYKITIWRAGKRYKMKHNTL